MVKALLIFTKGNIKQNDGSDILQLFLVKIEERSNNGEFNR